MAVEVPIETRRTVALALSPDDAFALLCDVPRWGALYPHVERVEPLPEAGPNAFIWTMEPLGPPGVAVRVTYACRYVADAATRTVSWTPIEGVGNAVFNGEASVQPGPDGGSVGALRLAATLWIPAPRLLRSAVRPAVAFEFGRMMDTFSARLAALR